VRGIVRTRAKVRRSQHRISATTDWVDGNLRLLGKERPDLDLSGSEITARIFRLREIYVKKLDDIHSQCGLKPRMFLVLAALYRSGSPYELSPASLMRHLMWSSGGLSQLLDRMEAASLIRRYKGRSGRQGVRVSLLGKGERIIADVLDVHCKTELRFIAPLNQRERMKLVSLLRKLLITAEGPQVLPPPANMAAEADRGRRRD